MFTDSHYPCFGLSARHTTGAAPGFEFLALNRGSPLIGPVVTAPGVNQVTSGVIAALSRGAWFTLWSEPSSPENQHLVWGNFVDY